MAATFVDLRRRANICKFMDQHRHDEPKARDDEDFLPNQVRHVTTKGTPTVSII